MTSLETVLTCTPCGATVDLRKEECKVVAFFQLPGNNLRLEWGCSHKEITNIEQAVGVTISYHCMMIMLETWLGSTGGKPIEEYIGEAPPEGQHNA